MRSLLRWQRSIFVVSNTLILTSSAGLTIGKALGANYVIAGLVAIAGGLTVFFQSRRSHNRPSPLWLIPAAAMIGSSVMTSHSAARVEDRYLLAAFTTIHYIATASWIGGLPYLLLVTKKVTDLDVLGMSAAAFPALRKSASRFFSQPVLASVFGMWVRGTRSTALRTASWFRRN